MVSKSPSRKSRKQSRSPSRGRPRSTSEGRSKTKIDRKSREAKIPIQLSKEEDLKNAKVTLTALPVSEEKLSSALEKDYGPQLRPRVSINYSEAKLPLTSKVLNKTNSKLSSESKIETKESERHKIDYDSTHFISKSKAREPNLIRDNERLSWLKISVSLCELIFLPLFVTCYLVICNELPDLNWKYKSYPNISVMMMFSIYVCMQLLLACMPFGKKVLGQNTKMGRMVYRCQGMFAFISTLVLFIGLRCLNVSLALVRENIMQLYAVNLIMAFVMSFILYLQSRRCPVTGLNIIGQTRWGIYNWFVGCEMNPRWKMIDLKLWLKRMSLIGWLSFLFCYTENVLTYSFSPTLLFAIGSQVWYMLDFFWHEDEFLTSSTMLNEGVGWYHCFYNLVYIPFMWMVPIRYAAQQNLELKPAVLGLLCLIYFVGYAIYRSSNSMKHSFRYNPYQTKMTAISSIPSVHGKKLITGSWWGCLRHPNYLGHLLMAFPMTLACGLVPLVQIPSIFLLCQLFIRAYKIDNLCKTNHGIAWKNYCHHVPYRLLPGIF